MLSTIGGADALEIVVMLRDLSERGLKNLEHNLQSVGKTGQASGSQLGASFLGLPAPVAIAGAAIAGFAALGAAVIPTYERVEQQEKALGIAFRGHGESLDQLRPKIDLLIKSGEQYAVGADDVRDAILRLTEAGRSFSEIETDMPHVMDLAKAKHLQLGEAARMYELALMGNQRALKDLGLVMPKVTNLIVGQKDATGHLITQQQVNAYWVDRQKTLNEKLTQAVGDQRKAVTPLDAAQTKLNNVWEKFSTTIGPAVVGALTFIVDAISTLVGWLVDLINFLGKTETKAKSLYDTGKALPGATYKPGQASGAPARPFSNPGGYPGRASGGPVLPGMTYMVGEEGPETLVMGSRGGYVIPRGGDGGHQQVIVVQTTIPLSIDGREVTRVVDRYMHRSLGMAGTGIRRPMGG